MVKKYDWMIGVDCPKTDSILKFFGLARYSVVKLLKNDIDILSGYKEHVTPQRWKGLVNIDEEKE